MKKVDAGAALQKPSALLSGDASAPGDMHTGRETGYPHFPLRLVRSRISDPLQAEFPFPPSVPGSGDAALSEAGFPAVPNLPPASGSGKKALLFSLPAYPDAQFPNGFLSRFSQKIALFYPLIHHVFHIFGVFST